MVYYSFCGFLLYRPQVQRSAPLQSFSRILWKGTAHSPLLVPRYWSNLQGKLHKIITLQLRRTKASPGKLPQLTVCSITSSRGTPSAIRPLSTGLQPFNHLLSLLLTSHWRYSLTELLAPSAEELGSTQSVQEAQNKTQMLLEGCWQIHGVSP